VHEGHFSVSWNFSFFVFFVFFVPFVVAVLSVFLLSGNMKP